MGESYNLFSLTETSHEWHASQIVYRRLFKNMLKLAKQENTKALHCEENPRVTCGLPTPRPKMRKAFPFHDVIKLIRLSRKALSRFRDMPFSSSGAQTMAVVAKKITLGRTDWMNHCLVDTIIFAEKHQQSVIENCIHINEMDKRLYYPKENTCKLV